MHSINSLFIKLIKSNLFARGLSLNHESPPNLSDEMMMRGMHLTLITVGSIALLSFAVNLHANNLMIASIEFARFFGTVVFWFIGYITKKSQRSVVSQMIVVWVCAIALMIAGGGILSQNTIWVVMLPPMILLIGMNRIAYALTLLAVISIISLALFSFITLPQVQDSILIARIGFAGILCLGFMMFFCQNALDWRNTLSEKLKVEFAKREQSQDIKNQFLIQVNHEIRNPINALMASIELLHRETQLELDGENVTSSRLENIDKRNHLIKTVKSSCNDVLSIMNDILELERLDTSKSTIEHAPFLIKTLACHVVNIFSPQASTSGSELFVRYEDGLENQWIEDVIRIRQILMNLVSNALKQASGSRITISFSKRDTWLSITVEDDGPGMSESVQKHLFQPFSSSFELDGSRSLGLQQCRIIVEKGMGGTIVVNDRIGGGTVFTVNLPINTNTSGLPISDPQQNTPIPAPIADRRPRFVLMVEDDPASGQMMKLLMEAEGMKVDLVTSSQQALDIGSELNNYTVFIVDQNLGSGSNLDGIGLTKVLHSCGLKNVIGFTGNLSTEMHKRWKEAGVHSIIKKPASCQTILNHIKDLEVEALNV